jgi:hypothetical protein
MSYKRVQESLLPPDIILPCESYEVILDFKSVYRCLPRDELFFVLNALSNRRCDVDTLWNCLEKLERKLLVYES